MLEAVVSIAPHRGLRLRLLQQVLLLFLELAVFLFVKGVIFELFALLLLDAIGISNILLPSLSLLIVVPFVRTPS